MVGCFTLSKVYFTLLFKLLFYINNEDFYLNHWPFFSSSKYLLNNVSPHNLHICSERKKKRDKCIGKQCFKWTGLVFSLEFNHVGFLSWMVPFLVSFCSLFCLNEKVCLSSSAYLQSSCCDTAHATIKTVGERTGTAPYTYHCSFKSLQIIWTAVKSVWSVISG